MSGECGKIERIIFEMEEEISLRKSEVERGEKELLVVENSIARVKMLQEKALHVIKCNEIKFREREELLETMRENFRSLRTTEAEDVGQNVTDELLRKIGELKNLRDSLQREFLEKSGVKN